MSSGECETAYGHDYDVYVEFEDTTGICWDEANACEPDPYFYACEPSAATTCDCPKQVGGSNPLSDTRIGSWSPFQLTIGDGDIYIFWVVDYDTDTPPYGDNLMPACCQIRFEGANGVDKLRSGQGMCAWTGGSLTTTFVAR